MTKTEILINELNHSMDNYGLPRMSDYKTRTFMNINMLLKTMSQKDILNLVKDYGMTIPALFLVGVNPDYVKTVTGKEFDADGFIRYTDLHLWWLTNYETKNLTLLYQQFDDLEIDNKLTKEEQRIQYIKYILEKCINSTYRSYKEIIDDFCSKFKIS